MQLQQLVDGATAWNWLGLYEASYCKGVACSGWKIVYNSTRNFHLIPSVLPVAITYFPSLLFQHQQHALSSVATGCHPPSPRMADHVMPLHCPRRTHGPNREQRCTPKQVFCLFPCNSKLTLLNHSVRIPHLRNLRTPHHTRTRHHRPPRSLRMGRRSTSRHPRLSSEEERQPGAFGLARSGTHSRSTPRGCARQSCGQGGAAGDGCADAHAHDGSSTEERV